MAENIKKDEKVLFLFPDLRFGEYGELYFRYHLGLGYVVAYLRKKNIEASFFIHHTCLNIHELVCKIIEQNVSIVGFCCFDTNYYFIKLIAEALKRKKRKVLIIVGGPTD